ncbi:MAG: hypothetical protein ACJA2S_001334 [Cyclobacteriaceae bacterium]|jgi:hypothetical protein
MSNKKTIVLIDNSIEGHKYAFAKLFTKYLLRLDCRVLLILPEKTGLIYQELHTELGALTDHLFHYDIELKQKKFKIHKSIDGLLTVINNWIEVKRIVRIASKRSGFGVHLVFFCWLDDFVTNYLPWQFVQTWFPYKWSGLYFHPWYLFGIDYNKVSMSSQDNVLKAANFIGAGVHDQILAKKLSDRVKKPILYFPELADGSKPLHSYELALDIRSKAKGRPVVGLIGLAKRKGFLHLIDVIYSDSDQQCFYFIAGSISTSDYQQSENGKVEIFLDNLPSNVFYYPAAIPEGEKINAVISSIDILFLVYHNFKSSSNFLTKAAIFKKLVIGVDAFWIGENIRAFQLGAVVTGDDPVITLGAIIHLYHNYYGFKANWADFLAINGEASLTPVFRELLSYAD